MATSIQDKIMRSVQAAEGLYYRLVLLVGATGTGKTGVLRAIASDLGTEVINVNLSLSSGLLGLTAKQRPLRVSAILERITEDQSQPILLDNLEILFGKELKQDPLRLLQGLSRNRVVVASWNGTALGGKLVYAKTGHPEYRSYDAADALIVTMDGMATIDSSKAIKGAEQE